MDILKCQLIRDQVSLLGYIISAEGKIPDPTKVTDIDKFVPQRDAKHLYSFLPFTNYFRKFIADHSKITAPLRKLLARDAQFEWGENHQQIVDLLKKRLQNPPILACFDATLPTIVSVDASQTGLGAILMQTKHGKDRVIEYASKSLNKHDTKLHSNVLECMVVHWAVTEKFAIYLRGGPKFTVLTDNYSITYLLNLSKINRRFARWTLDLMEFDFIIQHRSGASNAAADALSRLPSQTELACLTVIHTPNDRLRELQAADTDCQAKIRRASSTNSVYEVLDGILTHLSNRNGQPIHQIVIPNTLCETVMNMCHNESGHMGFEKTIDKIRRKHWWPNMDKQVRQFVAACPTCQRINQQTSLPSGCLIPRSIQSKPNAVISIDHIGLLPPIGEYRFILVCIDHATRYVDAVAVKSTSTNEYLDFLLNRWICRFRVPLTIVSDQGRGFVSNNAKETYRRFGILHVVSAAYWPQANGLVERMVATIKQALRKFVSARSSWVECLPTNVFAVNTSKQSSTKF